MGDSDINFLLGKLFSHVQKFSLLDKFGLDFLYQILSKPAEFELSFHMDQRLH